MANITTITIGGEETRTKSPRVVVYGRKLWTDEWQEGKYLWCKSLEFAASPTMPEAVLEWRYGNIQQADQSSKQVYDKLDISDWYVKICIDPDEDPDCDTNSIPNWYGRIVDVVDDQEGYLDRETEFPTGRQTFVCWGMESELETAILDKSQCETFTGGKFEINRAIAFNCGAGRPADRGEKVVGNRSQAIGPDGVYLFAADIESASEWTAYDIILYLLTYYAPKNSQGNQLQQWVLYESCLEFLKYYKPKLHVEGMTLKKVLDAIIDRRRGMGWYVDLAETSENLTKCFVNVFTQVNETTQLDSGETLDENPNQESLSVEKSPWVRKLQIRESEVTRYDQVVVRGGPIGAVFTLTTDGDIDKDWTDTDKAAYQTAASGEADYAGLTREEKQVRNDNFRMQTFGKIGEQMQRVYSWFKLVDFWEGITKDDYDAVLTQQWYPSLVVKTDQIDFQKPSNFWQTGLRFENNLPMLEHADYSGTQVFDETIAEIGAYSEFMRPLIIIKIDERDGDDVWQVVDKLSANSGNEASDEGGRGYSCNYRMRKDYAGFELKVSGNAQQHKIAKDDFTPCDETDDIPTDLNWKDLISITCYMKIDSNVEIRSPGDWQIESDADLFGKRIRRLYISVPDAHLDYILPDTIVGLRDGIAQYCTKPGVLRSDVKRLASIASIAAIWYCRPRKTITMAYKRIRKLTSVGNLIASLSQSGTTEDIQTVVSRVRYDFDEQTTTLQTHFCELDLRAM
jgi:hypothetical protein